MRRLVSELYGTTTLGDCAAALGYLATPRRLIRGGAIERYEREFARRIGVRHAVSFAAGRTALYALLRAFDVGEGDEVLVPLPTHVVVVNAVRYVGAVPIFVDCSAETITLDLDEAERRISPRTRVLIAQHTFGIPVDMDAAAELARRHDLVLIEDCVHALGSTFGGRSVGSIGRGAFFSTEETKTISSTMGGVATTDDETVGRRLRAIQDECLWPSASVTVRYLLKLILYHVLTHPEVHRASRPLYMLLGRSRRTRLAPLPTSEYEQRGERPPEYAQRLSNAQAALALRQLGRLDANVAHRRTTAAIYERALAARSIPTPRPLARSDPAYLRYPIRVSDAEQMADAVAPRAVLGRWFSSVIGEARSPADVGYVPGSCPRAERLAGHLVNLPTHPRVTAEDAHEIVAATVAAIEQER